ncbi:MAG: type II toxin-antitoxin system RelE/ParE family toxin [Sphingopyxis sp.]|nr:type II toxin-antitoxin system RelE/ParE family toxin [Sphingopyxis sp.]
MFEIEETSVYASWIQALRDRTAQGRILLRTMRLEKGNFGDVKSLGEGLHELRMMFGPGYRVYFTRRGDRIILLLCGGDKGSQSRDIDRARQLMADLE